MTSALALALAATLAFGPFPGESSPVTADAAPQATTAAQGPGEAMFLNLSYEVYRNVLTRFDGARCAHRPTCSRYGLLAVREHGPTGMLLTIDRLIRSEDSSAVRQLRLLHEPSGDALYDPVSESTFWFARAASAEPSRSAGAEPRAGTVLGDPLGSEFAASLMSEGDYYRAITEYKRFLFLHSEGPEAEAARFSIGLAYLRGSQSDAAAAHFSDLAQRYRAKADARRTSQASLQLAYSRSLGTDPALAFRALLDWRDDSADAADAASRARAAYLLGWTRLNLGDASGAAEDFQRPPPYPGQRSLVAAARALIALPSRSPLLAALLSIVPGAGHVYLGQPAIGLAAFGWNALFGFGVYDSFRRGDIGVGVVLAVFESLWYFGTMFGAVSGAHKYNRDVRLNALEVLRSEFDDRPESWPPATPASKP